MNKVKIGSHEFDALNVFYDSGNVETRKLQCHLVTGSETLQQIKTAFEGANSFEYGYYSGDEWRSIENFEGYNQINSVKFQYGNVIDDRDVTLCVIELDRPNLRTRFDSYVMENDAAICELYEMLLGGE